MDDMTQPLTCATLPPHSTPCMFEICVTSAGAAVRQCGCDRRYKLLVTICADEADLAVTHTVNISGGFDDARLNQMLYAL